eukprot:g8698.t2
MDHTTQAQQVVAEWVFKGEHPRLQDLLTEPDWRELFKTEMEKTYFNSLQQFLHDEWSDTKVTIYPPAKDIFKAFERTPYDKVKVVLIGQDPYHGPRQATGLSFSVPKALQIPSSLKNIYKEIKSDLGYDPGVHGDLEHWAEQGVLLLNSVLTVRSSQANSHRNKGWEMFTDHVIQHLNNEKENLVFILWGRQAQQKGIVFSNVYKSINRCHSCLGREIDRKRHCVLASAHPSGLSANRGFFGNKHFSKCNLYLESKGIQPIEWKVK